METEILEAANELISVKSNIKQLKNLEKQLKEELKSYLQDNGSIELEAGRIYYGESKGARTFSRPEVLEYIRNSYGESLADQIDQDCTKLGETKQTVYVKLSGDVEEGVDNE